MSEGRDPIRQENQQRDGVTPADARHVFREMIKAEIEAAPLTRRRRRELLDFAPHLDISEREALLLIRAVEIQQEDAELPSADPTLGDEHTIESVYVAHAAERPTSLVIALVLLSILLAGFVLAGLQL